MDVKIISIPRREKKSYMHFSVQENPEKEHYLVENQGGLSKDRYQGPRLEAWHTAPTPTGSYPTAKAGLASKRGPNELPYATGMLPVVYSETIAVGAGGPRLDRSCFSCCDWEVPRRDKVAVEMSPVLRPVSYRDSIVCYRDCSKRRYRSTTFYKPGMQQRHRAETVYMQPKCQVTTFSSMLDYESKAEPRWYTSTLELKPTTYSNTMVHKFGYWGTRLEAEDSEGHPRTPSPVSSDEGFDNGEFSAEGSPRSMASPISATSTVSSAPGEEESFRTKLVVNGYVRSSLTTLDDLSDDDIAEL